MGGVELRVRSIVVSGIRADVPSCLQDDPSGSVDDPTRGLPDGGRPHGEPGRPVVDPHAPNPRGRTSEVAASDEPIAALVAMADARTCAAEASGESGLHPARAHRLRAHSKRA
jgi:hypothetical protein